MAFEYMPILDRMQTEPPFAILRTSRPFRFFSGGRTTERLPPWPNMNLSARDGARDHDRYYDRGHNLPGEITEARGHNLPGEIIEAVSRGHNLPREVTGHSITTPLPREVTGHSITMGYHKEQYV